MDTISIEQPLKLLEALQSKETLEEAHKLIAEKLNEDQVSAYLKEYRCFYDKDPLSWAYSCGLFYLIQHIRSKIDIDAADVDVNQQNSVVNAIQECSRSSLEVCVKKQQRQRTSYNATDQSDSEYTRLTSCLRMFHQFFSIKLVAGNSLFDNTKIDFLIGVLAVIAMKRNDSDVKEFHRMFTQLGPQIGVELLFKFLMMIKVFTGLSKDFQVLVQRELMRAIRGENGFILLCRNLLVKGDENTCQKLEIIAKITEGASMHPTQRKAMTVEIFRTLRMCLINDEKDIISACVFVLKSFQAKANDEISDVISNEVLGQLDNLINPNTTLYGSILMEYCQFKAFVATLDALFSTSTVTSLPSKMLHQHLVALFNLYAILPEATTMAEREKLARVIQFVLNNSTRSEFQLFVKHLRLKDNSKVMKLNPRVCFKNNSLQVGEESGGLRDDTDSFICLLKSSNNSLLIFEAFVCLLKILSDVQGSSETYLAGYNSVDDDELPEVLHRKFFKKLSIIEPLQEMIQWKSLHTQLDENPKEILDAIREILEKSINEDEHIVIIFFSLFKELLGKIKSEEQRNQMRGEILKLKDKIKSASLRSQVTTLFDSRGDEIPNIDPSKIAYDDAMKLLQSNEIYCKVFGSDTLVKLLKRRDRQTIINRHSILATALQNMKETESYAYLNIIRLLTALTRVMDSDVIDALVVEFENSEHDIDQRLKFGEVIVRITEDLGQLSAKFKQQLIHCFLKGTRDNSDEFRTSSLANLGAICKILSYQIHSFFHEMFQQLEIIIKCDEYLPSKRAAAMVLSNILAGMPDLMAFQEFLLPIYHLLKEILATASDEQTRLHAQIGLEHLNEKTKDFLNPQLSVRKEIKIHLDKSPHKIDEIKYK